MHVGVLLFTMLALIIGVVSIGLTGVNIAKNGASLVPKVGHEDGTTSSSMRHIDFLVAVTSLSIWAFFFVACVLGYVRFCCHLRPHPVGYCHNLQTLCDMERPPRNVRRLLLRIGFSTLPRP